MFRLIVISILTGCLRQHVQYETVFSYPNRVFKEANIYQFLICLSLEYEIGVSVVSIVLGLRGRLVRFYHKAGNINVFAIQ